jgi:hypothetical protein
MDSLSGTICKLQLTCIQETQQVSFLFLNFSKGLFALGKMSYKVASLGKIQRAMATAIFGDVPFSTFDETIERFLAVEEILKDPTKKQYKELIIRNKVWLADSYYAKSDYENAKKW